ADLGDLDLKGILAIPNVGKSIAEKVHEYLQTGTIHALDELRSQVPTGVRALMAVPGLGPKKAMVMYQELGISSVDELREAVEDHRLAGLKGFGARTEENIVRGLQQLGASGERVHVNIALELAEELLGELGALKQVRRSAYAG